MSSNHKLLADLLSIHYPLLQAPMAGVTTPALAAAVSNAGALGGLGLGSSTVDQAREQIRQTRALTDAAFNVNFFCHRQAQRDVAREQAWCEYLRPHFAAYNAEPPTALRDIYRPFDDNPEMLAMLLEQQPAVVSFHFGVPQTATIEAIQGYGGRVLVAVTSLQEGQQAVAAGVDAIVAQGVEAGGHRGNFDAEHDEEMALLPLLSTLTDQLSIPVIAAGGIMNGRGVIAAEALGAAGVLLGTAFLLAPEAATSEAHRQMLCSDAAQHTAITRAISGRPARGMVGVFQRDIEPYSGDLPAYPVAYDAAKQLSAAAKARGSMVYLPNWAGQGAPQCRRLPAATLVDAIITEAGWS